MNQRQAEQLGRQTEQLKRTIAKVAEIEASTRRALDAQSAAFEQRLATLERALAAKDSSGKLAGAPLRNCNTRRPGGASSLRDRGHPHPPQASASYRAADPS